MAWRGKVAVRDGAEACAMGGRKRTTRCVDALVGNVADRIALSGAMNLRPTKFGGAIVNPAIEE